MMMDPIVGSKRHSISDKQTYSGELTIFAHTQKIAPLKLISRPSELSGDIDIPASKSHTIRAVALAAMAEGTSILENPLVSDDAESALVAAREFGAQIEYQGKDIHITGVGGKLVQDAKKIDVANSGTSLRIFSALAALSDIPIEFDGDASIRKRPMTSLFSALEALGAKVNSSDQKCPFTIQGPIRGGKTQVDGISSQFLTAVLFAAPLCPQDTEIEVYNLHEKPYVEITLDWLRQQGIRFENQGLDKFKVFGGQSYKAFHRRIPADFSSATFAAVAAAISGAKLKIKGLDFADHQGDKEVFSFLKRMGMNFEIKDQLVETLGGRLKGIEIDMNNTPDALPAMAVAACFAEGKTALLNVAQARLKECDRISAVATELSKMGAKIEELPDGLVIHQSDLKGIQVHGYHDHRMVMSLALAGMRSTGITEIDTAEAVSVTYPSFVDDYKRLGAQLTINA